MLWKTVRSIIRSPAFFGAAVLLIAIGIAAVTTTFAFLDALLLRPLPVRDPENLIQIVLLLPNPNLRPISNFSFDLYRRLANESSTLFDIVGQSESSVTLESGGEPERAYVQAVTDNFFTALGTEPAAGSVFRSGAAPVAVLSYEGWSRYFGRDPAVIGRVVRLGGHPFQIIGVTPKEFNGTNPDVTPMARVPYGFVKQLGGFDHDFLEIVARLKPGVPREEAQKEVAAVWKSFPQALTGMLNESRIEVRSIKYGASYLRDQFRIALMALMAGTALLLLIVCSNVGGLLLARGAAHAKETAVRLALGATRQRIIAQYMLESMFLTFSGGAAGTALAFAGIPFLMRWMPKFPLNSIDLRASSVDVHVNSRVIVFAIASCGITSILSALAPAWSVARDDLYPVLRGVISDIRHRRLQTVLCSVQITLCMVLIVSAGLMIRTLSNLSALDPGFDREHVAIFSIDPRLGKYDSRRIWLLQERLVREAQSIPGVEAAALGSVPLMRGMGMITGIGLPGQGEQLTNVGFVTPEYFEVMKMRVVAGRRFLPTDKPDAKPQPVIVNEAFVRQFLWGRNPVGTHLGRDGNREIIGVVNDSYYRSLRESPPPILYSSPFGPDAYPTPFTLYVRTRNSAEAMVEPIRKRLQSIDPKIPIHEAATIRSEIHRSLWRDRFIAALAGSFGVFALLLSAIGLYGVLAYYVAQRQRELSLRLALGATPLDVIETVSRRIAPVMIGGLACGLVAYFIAGRSIQSLFFGIGFADPVFIGIAVLIILATAAGACAIPIYRALHLDAASVLKQE
jgi:putative ABC transport system permease protein